MKINFIIIVSVSLTPTKPLRKKTMVKTVFKRRSPGGGHLSLHAVKIHRSGITL